MYDQSLTEICLSYLGMFFGIRLYHRRTDVGGLGASYLHFYRSPSLKFWLLGIVQLNGEISFATIPALACHCIPCILQLASTKFPIIFMLNCTEHNLSH